MIALADCMEWLAFLEEGSLDAIVTDPPYGLGFMGKAWDAMPPGVEWARLCLRALKPGGHLVAFGGTRTVHRLACAIEDAGFEIRDQIGWVYYSGFPKSLDVSKAIDAAEGAEREVVSEWRTGRSGTLGGVGALSGLDTEDVRRITAPATPDAKRWQGWGTALKPAIEPAILARKPLAGTVAANVLKHGTGALNIDGCRFAPGDAAWVGPNEGETSTHSTRQEENGLLGTSTFKTRVRDAFQQPGQTIGRWPANLYACPKASREERERGLGPDNMLCKCQDTRSAWDEEDRRASTPPGTDTPPRRDTTASTSTDAAAPVTSPALWRASGVVKGLRVCLKCGKWDRQPSGSAAVDRDDGTDGLKPRAGAGRTAKGVWCVHPTVKPVRLMRWLVRLVTPPGGTVADPFMGSGTTAVAALLEGFRVIGCEREPEYHAIATARANHAERWPSSWSDTAPGSDAEADSEIEHVERMGQVPLFGGAK